MQYLPVCKRAMPLPSAASILSASLYQKPGPFRVQSSEQIIANDHLRRSLNRFSKHRSEVASVSRV